MSVVSARVVSVNSLGGMGCSGVNGVFGSFPHLDGARNDRRDDGEMRLVITRRPNSAVTVRPPDLARIRLQ